VNTINEVEAYEVEEAIITRNQKRVGRRVKITRPVVGILFALAIFFWLNISPYLLYQSLFDFTFVHYLLIRSAAFDIYLPWLNYWILASILINTVRVYNRNWTTFTRSADLAARLYGIIILCWMVFGPPVTRYPWLSVIFDLCFLFISLGLAIYIIVRLVQITQNKPVTENQTPGDPAE
jgi:hypothetical protein